VSKINTDSWDDAKLLSLLRQGNEDAFRALVQKYQARLFRTAYGITYNKEESAEIVQEVFLKVWENLHSFREESKLSTWLYRITVNLCLNWKRTWKRRFRHYHQPIENPDGSEIPELTNDEEHPESALQKKEQEKILWEKIGELPEDARAILVLKECEGLSYDEIADLLKIKKGTVSSRLFYARQRLKELLKDYFDEKEGA